MAERTQAPSTSPKRGQSLDEYIAGLEPWQAEIASALRKLVREAEPDLAEVVKWGQPVFEAGGPVCYIKPFKSHVNFGFWRGAELQDPEGLLEVGGSKMGHVKLKEKGEIRKKAFQELVRQAVDLNRRLGNPAAIRK
ncbi:MAG TPA: DUF1801 domain-containing protein [Thermoanaerobaculia bacterium]